MHNLPKHTRSLAALCLLLFLALPAPAQQEEDDADSRQEEIYIPPPLEEKEEEEYGDTSMFNLISYSSLQPLETRQVPPSGIERLKDDDDFWYANADREKKKKEQPSKSFPESVRNKPWFKTLVWLLIGGAFVVIIILFLSSSNITLFRKKTAAVQEKGEEEGFGQDIFSMDHEREISRAEAQGDLRRAIRHLYLRTLKELAEKELIQYRDESTDSDYLRQLAQTGYYRDFGRLTRHFQYAWYGKFAVAPPLYKMVGEDFANFKNRLAA